jgi:hypothetical protein
MKYKGRELVEVVITWDAFVALFSEKLAGLFEVRTDGKVSLWLTQEYSAKLCHLAASENSTISDVIVRSAQLQDFAARLSTPTSGTLQ